MHLDSIEQFTAVKTNVATLQSRGEENTSFWNWENIFFVFKPRISKVDKHFVLNRWLFIGWHFSPSMLRKAAEMRVSRFSLHAKQYCRSSEGLQDGFWRFFVFVFKKSLILCTSSIRLLQVYACTNPQRHPSSPDVSLSWIEVKDP